MSSKPDFIIIGTAKSGSTSLVKYLRQHPDVYMSKPKEPNYFIFSGETLARRYGPVPWDDLYHRLYRWSVTDASAYRALFENAGDAKAVGEASVLYCYDPGVAHRIKQAVPDARLVAILRHPVDRMYSHYLMNQMHGLEPLGFESALDAENARVDAGWGWDWHYRRISQYVPQLNRYIELFGREQLKIVTHDQLTHSPESVVRDVFRHINVNPAFIPDCGKRYRVSYRTRSHKLASILESKALRQRALPLLGYSRWRRIQRFLRAMNYAPAVPLGEGKRQALRRMFESEFKKLESIVGAPLPW